MEDLLPREAYAQDETGYWPRMAIAIGIVSGVCMAVFLLITVRGVGTEMFGSSRVLNGPGRVPMVMVGGLLFGVIFSGLFCSQVRRVHQAGVNFLFHGDGNLVKMPDTVENISYRLVCSWMVSTRFGIWGILFLSKNGEWEFIPHRENLERHRQVRKLGPVAGLTISAVVDERNLLQRVLLLRPETRLRLSWQGGSAKLAVPKAREVAARLNAEAIAMGSGEKN